MIVSVHVAMHPSLTHHPNFRTESQSFLRRSFQTMYIFQVLHGGVKQPVIAI